jgi:hypothetical protein
MRRGGCSAWLEKWDHHEPRSPVRRRLTVRLLMEMRVEPHHHRRLSRSLWAAARALVGAAEWGPSHRPALPSTVGDLFYWLRPTFGEKNATVTWRDVDDIPGTDVGQIDAVDHLGEVLGQSDSHWPFTLPKDVLESTRLKHLASLLGTPLTLPPDFAGGLQSRCHAFARHEGSIGSTTALKQITDRSTERRMSRARGRPAEY